PYFTAADRQEILRDIEAVLESGRLTLGPRLKEFESQFAGKVGATFSVGVTSATAGLHMSMLALGIKPGDEVIVPAKTFVSTANAPVYCGAKPVFCDVQPDSMNMDPKDLRKLVTTRTRAVIPVHVAGQPCDMDEIMEVCDANSIDVVEDSAHAPYALYKEKVAGTIGKIGVYSFYPDKVIASSDGGMLVTADEELADRLHLLRNCGRRNLREPDIVSIGYNYRMNELQAVLGIHQLKTLDEMLETRRLLARYYDEQLEGMEGIAAPTTAPGRTHDYYAYVVFLEGFDRDAFQAKLAERGIETALMFKPVYLHKPYLDMGYGPGLCPVAEQISENTVSIPLHPGLSTDDAGYVIDEIKEILSE
ncbi:MAG: DegT/DnrJ/EryC1/StrS family aminotransferase, partial [Thaumarchaeota archaeon]|nr:DegT/DnrJ/EryC1/StrS family aminotransferase [Nitrososphaerota archaeon]